MRASCLQSLVLLPLYLTAPGLQFESELCCALKRKKLRGDSSPLMSESEIDTWLGVSLRSPLTKRQVSSVVLRDVATLKEMDHFPCFYIV